MPVNRPLSHDLATGIDGVCVGQSPPGARWKEGVEVDDVRLSGGDYDFNSGMIDVFRDSSYANKPSLSTDSKEHVDGVYVWGLDRDRGKDYAVIKGLTGSAVRSSILQTTGKYRTRTDNVWLLKTKRPNVAQPTIRW